jgi:hypothetical protein
VKDINASLTYGSGLFEFHLAMPTLVSNVTTQWFNFETKVKHGLTSYMKTVTEKVVDSTAHYQTDFDALFAETDVIDLVEKLVEKKDTKGLLELADRDQFLNLDTLFAGVKMLTKISGVVSEMTAQVAKEYVFPMKLGYLEEDII